MLQPARHAKSRFFLLLLVATAISLLTLDFRGFGPLETVQRRVRGVLEPVAGTADRAFDPVRNAWNGVFDYGDLQEENAQLRRQVAELKENPTLERSARQQLETLMRQQGIDAAPTAERRLARVVSGPVSNFENNIRIDRGTDDGVDVNMVVVTEDGLVGRIAEVTPSRSVVELVDSQDFGIGVRLATASAPVTFTLRGQGRGQPLRIQGQIPAGTVRNDDALVTSGLDRSLFPSDIPVGRIVNVPEATPGGGASSTMLENVEVRPFVDPRELTFVTVLLWRPRP